METLIIIGMMSLYVCDPFLCDYDLVRHNLSGYNFKNFNVKLSDYIHITTTTAVQTALFGENKL